jgi:hypothetical protein
MAVLKNNGQLTVHLPKTDQCRFDAHVVYQGAAADSDLKGLDICASPQVTLPP